MVLQVIVFRYCRGPRASHCGNCVPACIIAFVVLSPLECPFWPWESAAATWTASSATDSPSRTADSCITRTRTGQTCAHLMFQSIPVTVVVKLGSNSLSVRYCDICRFAWQLEIIVLCIFLKHMLIICLFPSSQPLRSHSQGRASARGRGHVAPGQGRRLLRPRAHHRQEQRHRDHQIRLEAHVYY